MAARISDKAPPLRYGRQRANEMARKILAEYHPQHLPEDVAAEVDRMAQAAQKRAIENAARV